MAVSEVLQIKTAPPQPQPPLVCEVRVEGDTLLKVLIALNEVRDQLEKGSKGDGWTRPGRKARYVLQKLEPAASVPVQTVNSK